MAYIELVIKIPEEVKQAFDCAESNDLKGCYYDHGGVVGNAIKSGKPLPEGHSDLIDRNELLKQPIDTANYPSNYVRLAKAIVEADKTESEDYNCMACAHDGDSNICNECEDGSKYLKIMKKGKNK